MNQAFSIRLITIVNNWGITQFAKDVFASNDGKLGHEEKLEKLRMKISKNKIKFLLKLSLTRYE